MIIEGEKYRVAYDFQSGTITLAGSMRLFGSEGYAPIVKLLDDIARKGPGKIILDLRELKFLNSSGINVLSRFVIKVRNRGKSGITVKGSTEVSWQKKSLKNLQRLMQDLELEFD